MRNFKKWLVVIFIVLIMLAGYVLLCSFWYLLAPLIKVIIIFVMISSLSPIMITFIWLFKTKELGYSWRETCKIEFYNSKIHTYERAGYMRGYNLEDIRAELPKEIKYKKKN